MPFDFATADRIVFGRGTLQQLATLAPGFGRNAFVVTGQGGAGPQRLFDILEAAGLRQTGFEVAGEPGVALARQAVAAARQAGCDFVIGFGGGSVLDTAKAVGAMLTNPGDLMDYLEVVGQNQPLTQPAAPVVAIPTTAGTGTEVTRNAVLAVPEKRVKVSLRSAYLLPALALVDPDLTVSVPPAVTASTGMDALTQVIEPFVSVKANPFTDLFCREGMACMARSLRAAFRDGANLEARQDMSWGSLLGGLSLANAGLGAVHGFAGPIGGMFDAPHGAVCARLLPFVTEMNLTRLGEAGGPVETLDRYRQIAVLLTGDPGAETEDGAAWLHELITDLDIPPLRAYVIQDADFEDIAEKSQRASSMKGNPVALERSHLLEILARAH